MIKGKKATSSGRVPFNFWVDMEISVTRVNLNFFLCVERKKF